MDMSAFTTFTGRIGRQTWWIGTIVMIVVMIVLSFIVNMVFGVSMMGGLDPTAGPDVIAGMMRKLAISQLITLVIIAYPVTALMKKRLNDRNRPDWIVYVFWAPTVLNVLLGLLGLGLSSLTTVVALAALAVGIWALVELGFLRGTVGPNPHGPDPVAA